MNQFSLSGCDYLIFSGDSEDENCHLVSGTFTFQVCKSSKKQGGPFFGRQKRHFSAYCRIKFKLILIMKMMISVMKIVILLMFLLMKMT